MTIDRFTRRGSILEKDSVQRVLEDLPREVGCIMGTQKKILTILSSFFPNCLIDSLPANDQKWHQHITRLRRCNRSASGIEERNTVSFVVDLDARVMTQ
jgi:hypothetical protein